MVGRGLAPPEGARLPLDPNWRSRAESPAAVVARIASRDRVFIHGACATPLPLVQALAARRDLEDVELYHLHTSGAPELVAPSVRGRLHSNSLFTGAICRAPIAEGWADVVPIFLSEIPWLFKTGEVPLDVAVLQVSPPDRHGHCTLGTSVDAAMAAADHATTVLAEINVRMPRTLGHTVVPLSRLAGFCLTDRPLAQSEPARPTHVEARIGEIVADLVDDGATLQMGIGAIPDAVVARLGNKVDLGVHTEMFSDGLVPLLENGVVTNRHKEVHRHRTVTSFVSGTTALFDHVHENMRVEFHPCDRTNDTHLIGLNPKVTAINSALEIDLTGQVCADSLGHRIFSGIGGQMDFIRGAARSKGGKPIIALPSTAAGGQVSRITATLTPGAGVVTTRGHVRWIVTEHGAVNLWGKTLRQRADLLIGIAHPDFRAGLRREVNAIRHFDLDVTPPP
jgi:4-hydroxybutyrate CoA-transferase